MSITLSAQPDKAANYALMMTSNIEQTASRAYEEALSIVNNIEEIVKSIGSIEPSLSCSGGDYDGKLDYSIGPPPTPPDLGDLEPPDPITEEFNETLPTLTDLGTLLQSKLYTEINNGSTGLSQSTMDDLYDWEEESDLQDLQDTKDRIATEWARNGSILPDSTLYALQAWADITHQNKRLSKSRDVRIESEKIAIDNMKFAKTLAHNLEDTILRYIGDYWRRRLEYVIAVVRYGYMAYEYILRWKEAFVNLYRAEAEGYGAMVGALRAEATVEAAELTAKSRFDAAHCAAQADVLRVQVEQLRGQAEVASTAAASIGRIGAALAAGAMSALHAGATVNYQGSETYSQSEVDTTSTSDITSNNTSFVTSNNTSAINSTSTNTNTNTNTSTVTSTNTSTVTSSNTSNITSQSISESLVTSNNTSNITSNSTNNNQTEFYYYEM